MNPILKEYGVKYVYLFGSYAKKKATVKSDIDILISNDVTGNEDVWIACRFN